MFTITITSD